MKKTILMLAFSVAIFNSAYTQSNTKLTAEFEKVVKEQFPFNETGATVLVSSQGNIIYHKAVGMANVELHVPMQTGHIFRIGSITKQFTAIAILQLMEAGKLNLQDEITRFLPGYPVQGAIITIEHLLTRLHQYQGHCTKS